MTPSISDMYIPIINIYVRCIKSPEISLILHSPSDTFVMRETNNFCQNILSNKPNNIMHHIKIIDIYNFYLYVSTFSGLPSDSHGRYLWQELGQRFRRPVQNKEYCARNSCHSLVPIGLCALCRGWLLAI